MRLNDHCILMLMDMTLGSLPALGDWPQLKAIDSPPHDSREHAPAPPRVAWRARNLCQGELGRPRQPEGQGARGIPFDPIAFEGC